MYTIVKDVQANLEKLEALLVEYRQAEITVLQIYQSMVAVEAQQEQNVIHFRDTKACPNDLNVEHTCSKCSITWVDNTISFKCPRCGCKSVDISVDKPVKKVA